MSMALPYAHMPPIFAFTTLPIEPDYTTMTAMWCNLPCNPCDLVQPMLASACTQHYYRHLIVLVIGFRHSTQAFVLISSVHTDKKGWTEYTPPYTSHFAPLPHAYTHTLPHAHTLPCTHTCTSPPFALLPVHIPSPFIRLYTTWFSTFSLI